MQIDTCSSQKIAIRAFQRFQINQTQLNVKTHGYTIIRSTTVCNLMFQFKCSIQIQLAVLPSLIAGTGNVS